MPRVELYNPCFDTSYFILRLWLYELEESLKAKGNLLKLEVLFAAKKRWSGLIISKQFSINLTFPQGFTEKNVFVVFPELTGFEQ